MIWFSHISVETAVESHINAKLVLVDLEIFLKHKNQENWINILKKAVKIRMILFQSKHLNMENHLTQHWQAPAQ